MYQSVVFPTLVTPDVAVEDDRWESLCLVRGLSLLLAVLDFWPANVLDFDVLCTIRLSISAIIISYPGIIIGMLHTPSLLRVTSISSLSCIAIFA